MWRSSKLLVLCLAMFSGAVVADSQPNIVLILVDDLGWSDLSIQGSSFYETPYIDALAASGTRFVNAYASSPVCSPTRAAILTGKNPARLGITNWIPGDDPHDRKLLGPKNELVLPLAEVTLAEALREDGYATFFAGKWHLGKEDHYPERQGFDHNVGGGHLGRPPGGYYAPYANPTLVDGPDGEYLTDRLTSETLAFIDANQDGPFFVYLNFYAVHTPLEGADSYIDKYAKKQQDLVETGKPEQEPEHAGLTKQRQDNVEYASMVHAVDINVGRITSALDELGIADSTHVIFASDNGGRSTLYGPGDATSNLPLRAGKGWLYEGGIRVPLIVRSPGHTEAGMVSQQLVVSTDFYPTVLELAGSRPRAEQHIDGLSFAPALADAAPGLRETAFFYFPHYHGSASMPSAAVRHNNWKLVVFYETGVAELYDLQNDLGEQHDVASQNKTQAARMFSMLDSWTKKIGAKLPSINQDYVAGEEELNFRGLEPQ